jgi:hypothetical protein
MWALWSPEVGRASGTIPIPSSPGGMMSLDSECSVSLHQERPIFLGFQFCCPKGVGAPSSQHWGTEAVGQPCPELP